MAPITPSADVLANVTLTKDTRKRLTLVHVQHFAIAPGTGAIVFSESISMEKCYPRGLMEAQMAFTSRCMGRDKPSCPRANRGSCSRNGGRCCRSVLGLVGGAHRRFHAMWARGAVVWSTGVETRCLYGLRLINIANSAIERWNRSFKTVVSLIVANSQAVSTKSMMKHKFND